MKMILPFFALFFALSVAPLADADGKPADGKVAPIYEITATGNIEIGPDGTVHRYELDKGQPATIEQAVARSIAKWRFGPVTLDGRPVIAATRMRMRIAAEPTATGDYQLRISGVWFGEPGRNAYKPPRYPEEALHADVGAKVVLVLVLDEHGKVTRIHAEQVSLSRRTRNERIAEQWRDVFLDASVAAAKHWIFDINETVGGAPVGASVRIPVEFSITPDGDADDNIWQAYVPGPYHPIPWRLTTDSRVGIAATGNESLKGGSVQSLNSRFQLTTPVIGALL